MKSGIRLALFSRRNQGHGSATSTVQACAVGFQSRQDDNRRNRRCHYDPTPKPGRDLPVCQRRSEIASAGRSKIASRRGWRVVVWDMRHGWRLCSVARAVKAPKPCSGAPWARGLTARARTELSSGSRDARLFMVGSERRLAMARQFSGGSSDDGSCRERFARRLLWASR